MLRLLTLSLSSLALLLTLQTAEAAGTASGTLISNVATITYSIDQIDQAPITSAATTILVDNMVNLTVAETSGTFTTVDVASGTVDVIAAFTVTNNGNTLQDYVLTIRQGLDGQSLFGKTDNFDVINCSNVVESGANSGYQPLEDTATFIDELVPDKTKIVYVLCSMPSNQVNDDISIISLLATTHTGGSAGIRGELTTADAGANIADAGANIADEVQRVFIDASAGDPQADNTARNGQHSSRDGYWVTQTACNNLNTVALAQDLQLDVAIASGNENDTAAILSAISGWIGTDTEIYKDDQGDGEEGSAKESYSTTYNQDLSTVEIVWDGAPDLHITGPSYLLVKGGEQESSWYLFDISSWDGMATISLSDFWPGTDSISHISIFNEQACDYFPPPRKKYNPGGVVFDSLNGLAVDGAIVTLIDVDTGLIAEVFCDDGINASPNPIVTGSSFPQCGGVVLSQGAYRFPLIDPGTYVLRVAPPSSYTFSSVVSPESLPAGFAIEGSPGAGGSFGTEFHIFPADPARHTDIPIDPLDGDLKITKNAGKSVVGEGEYVPYTLTITNSDTDSATWNVQIADHLPLGFRYQAGSARLNGERHPAPVIRADGRTLTFALGDIAAAGSVTLNYVAQVTAGAKTGKAENVAASIGAHTSNTARASVIVREDLMRSRAILMGRVIIGSCDDSVTNDKDGLQNARIVLEDGTTILTDKDGRWHADNILPGTHVVQLDVESLPANYEVATCEDNTRFAGRNYSQFVNVRGGTLWRADFHVQKIAPKELRFTQRLTAQRDGDSVQVTLQLQGTDDVGLSSSTLLLSDGVKLVPGSVQLDGKASEALSSSDGFLTLRLPQQQGLWANTLTLQLKPTEQTPLNLVLMTRFVAPSTSKNVSLPRTAVQLAVGTEPVTVENFAIIPRIESPKNATTENGMGTETLGLVEQLPYDAQWLASAQPGAEWLHPQETFLPALPAIKAAVKLDAGQHATLILNGEEVNPLYYDGATFNATRSVILATWSGVHIKTSDNLMELIVKDASGKEILRQSRNIHYSLSPNSFEFVPEQSRLIADGKTRPIIAIRFLDKDGYKMRRGAHGEFQLNPPYQSAERLDAIQRDPLGGGGNNKPRFRVGEDGIALIELAPTTQSGEAKLNFEFSNGRKQEMRTWLEAGQRDWILVGFAEGTLGHKQLSGNLSALKEAEADTQLYDGNRLAFYAKGTIKGEYLMTIAYDSAKASGSGLTNLKQAIDPNLYYTLYADATQPAFDAASTNKLYLKIERKKFYVLFGDYDTGLTTTEFAQYNRTVTGLKSEYKGETVGYTAFATMTSQAYVKDELPGDGTSGLYQLTRTNILDNSDNIHIEVRERFQSQNIVSTQTMTRYLDYDIDYINGTLFFKQPVSTLDATFNRVFIVAEYESDDSSDETLTVGGRINIKPSDTLEIGATLVSDGTEGASGNLQGLDATWMFNDSTKIEAEFARSDREVSNLELNGNAWKVELIHPDTKLYIRQQQGGFGIGQQAGSESNTRKAGAEHRVKITDTLQMQAEVYREEKLGIVESRRDVFEGHFNHNLGNMTAYYGARLAYDDDGLGVTRDSEQAIAGGGYTFVEQKITLHADSEINVGSAQSWDFPDRIKVGADYNISPQTKLFVEHEISRGEDINSDTTLSGLRTPLWKGAEMAASLGTQNSLDSGRLYSNLGIVQKWQISKFWSVDFGIDRVNTLSSTAPSSTLPRTSDPAIADYTAVKLGASYNAPVWGANSDLEWRTSETDEKINFRSSFRRTLDAGRILSSSVTYTGTRSAVSQSSKANVRLSYAHRPSDSAWIWLNRLDYIDERSSGNISDTHTRKLVNNLNMNWIPKRGTQVSLQYGSKYVLDDFNDASNSGYTDLTGVELRHDLNPDWDVGVHASVLHTWTGGEQSYGLGASLGYKLMDNTWVAVGYNLRGFDDDDFSGAAYRSQGPYIALRVKFDQDTIKEIKNSVPFDSTQ